MEIGSNVNSYAYQYDLFNNKEKDEENPLCMKNAKEAYMKKILTGKAEPEKLTAEEKERITALVQQHIGENMNRLSTDEGKTAFTMFLESLHQKFGLKKGFIEHIQGFIDELKADHPLYGFDVAGAFQKLDILINPLQTQAQYMRNKIIDTH